ncbi:hypothetical protein B296_00039696 [Ensete ventricosum]|uniref:Uncharacterized protein n=1 Tax=Ensete ventricosum TaxID=4639 RepID=A0A426X3S9_ENSVE|nr:hypothetical protein B296_00039696 [Ensete ventricosum]
MEIQYPLSEGSKEKGWSATTRPSARVVSYGQGSYRGGRTRLGPPARGDAHPRPARRGVEPIKAPHVGTVPARPRGAA